MINKDKYSNKFLNSLIKDKGFKTFDFKGIQDIAVLSLRIALLQYFSTYNILKYYSNDYNKSSSINYPKDYYEAYSETIYHFLHFFELLIRNHATKSEKYRKARTLENVLSGIKEKQIIIEGFPIFSDIKTIEAIDALRTLRNEITHKGTYILGYSDFDEYIGKYILSIINTKEIKVLQGDWLYKRIHCGIDPIDEIVQEFKKKNFDYKKIAWLKEIGRAAYNNPIDTNSSIKCNSNLFRNKWEVVQNDDIVRNAKNRVKYIINHSWLRRNTGMPTICPVCGIETLVQFIDDIETGFGDECYEYIKKIECMCCGFEIYYDLDNPDEHELLLEKFFKE